MKKALNNFWNTIKGWPRNVWYIVLGALSAAVAILGVALRLRTLRREANRAKASEAAAKTKVQLATHAAKIDAEKQEIEDTQRDIKVIRETTDKKVEDVFSVDESAVTKRLRADALRRKILKE